MDKYCKWLNTGVLTAVMVISFTAGAFAQGAVGGESGSAASSAGTKGFLRLRATVICTTCSLEEAKTAHPGMNDLYELSHGEDKMVIHVTAVNDMPGAAGGEIGNATTRWISVSNTPQLSVRAEDRLVKTLMDQRNVAKEVEITGIIRTTHTLDISDITVLG